MTPNPSSYAAMASQKLHCNYPFQLSTPLEGTPQYNRTFKGHHAGRENTDPDRASDAYRDPFGRLSDTHLASRRASEAAERRFQAASWLQYMVGPLVLSAEPSEEELRLCLRNGLVLCNLINKVHPGAVPKIVENPTLSSPPPEGAALSAFQYFENVRNFLVAVEEMKLPSFDASDLEKGDVQLGWSAKVVDCILSIRAYHDWQQAGGQGFWKLGGPFKTPCLSKSSLTKSHVACSWLGSGRSLGVLALSASKENSQNPKQWGLDSLKDMSEEYGNLTVKVGPLWRGHSADFMEESENTWANIDSSVAWVQHVCQKFVDTFMARSKSSQQASVLGIPDTNMPCEALLKLVMAVLDDKNPEEVAMLVEFMLKKVIDEFGQRTLSQEGQDLSKGSQDCPEQYTKKKALQQAVHNAKSMDQPYALKLELQSNELKELKCLLETIKLQFQDLQYGWEEKMESLNVKLRGLSQAAAEYHKVAAENRELYNQVQDLKGNIRVYCRVRPFLPGQNRTRSTVDFIGEKGSIVIVNPAKQGKEQRKAFTFNKIFGPSAAQEEVFLDTQPLIRSVLDGYNVCIFAYGQTGSGKTYTMTGPNDPSPKDWGVNFRALHDLFQISQHRQDLMRYEVGVQMMEIYNEQVRDLLCTYGTNKRLEIRNNSQQDGLNVPDATLLPVKSVEDVLELMTLGHKNRTVGATALNERSSRSHSVLTVHVKGKDLASGSVLRGCLHLVDLAGSERVDKSEATGDRLKEAQHINKSLSALGDVIAALAQKTPHVPYRNSKLTQLLQDSLGGQAKTLMFVHVSPDDDSYGETISTLKFAERVATVELGAAHSNKESGEVKDLKDQIAFLRDALARKEGELERYQKEHRIKSSECLPDRPRVRAGISPGQLGIVTGDGKRRLPLGEVRNAEIHQSPGVGQKCVASTDFQVVNLLQPVSPLEYVPEVAPPYSYGFEEDSLKRRARQATSPDSRSSSASTSEVSFPRSARVGSNSGSKKNKIRHGSFDELEPYVPRASHERTRNFSVQSYRYDDVERTFEGSEIDNRPNAKHGDRKKHLPLPLHHASITKPLPMRDLRSSAAPLKEVVDSGDSYLTEEEPVSQRDDMGEDEEIVSDYSEVESWHMDGPDHHSNGQKSMASFGKRRKEGDIRFPGQHQPGHLAKKPSTASVQALMGASRKQHALVGLATSGMEPKRKVGLATSGMEPKRKGGKAPPRQEAQLTSHKQKAMGRT